MPLGTPTEHLDQYTHYCNQAQLRLLQAPHHSDDRLLPEVPMPFTEESTVDYLVLTDTVDARPDRFLVPPDERFVIHCCADDGFLFYCQGYYELDDEDKHRLCLGVVFSPEWASGFVFYDVTAGGLQAPRSRRSPG